MNRVLYSGKVMDENELRRVNCILQTQANNMWAEVRTYDFLYKSSYRNYLNGYIEYSDSSSEYSETISEIDTMNTIVNSTMNVEGVQEAQQAAQQAADDSVSNRTENENEAIEGLPDDLPEPSDLYGANFQDTLDKYGYNEEKEQTSAWVKTATEDALALIKEQSQENIKNNEDAQSLVKSGQTGTANYFNPETGQTQTVTVNSDGTVTLSGVTASDGTVGTVTQKPDGTMEFTPNGSGESMPWTGGKPEDIIKEAGDGIKTQADSDIEKAKEQAEEAKKEYEQIKAANENAFNQATQEEAAKMAEETPSGNERGYSESDSSSWSDPSYDPSEWEGF